MTLRRLWCTAIAVYLALGVLTLGVRPLQVPDEARYGIIPSEMVEKGDWLALRLAGFHFYEKPPLVYWMTAASISMFGQTPFAIRLPSALATLGTALVAAWLAVRVSGRREAGPLAFLVQATTIGPMVLGSVAVLDPTFAALVAASMGAMHAACSATGRARLKWLALAGVAAGFAFLAKGLLAFAIPGVACLAYLAWERRWRDMLTMPWVPLAAAAVTLAPFAWAVERANPGFWSYFVMKEHVRRAVAPDATQQPQPWWFYALALPVGAMLWTVVWPHAARGLRTAAEWRTGTRFMLCWAFAPLLALSFSGGKLATYALPMFAPIAVCVALGLLRCHRNDRIAPFAGATVVRGVLRLAGVVFLFCAAAGAVVGTHAMGLPTLWDTNQSVHLAAIGIALMAWAQLDAWSWRAPDSTVWLARTALAPVPLLAMLPFLYPTEILTTTKYPWPFLATHTRDLQAAHVLITAGSSPGLAVSWATGRRDMIIAGWPDEFDNELGRADEKPRRIEWAEVGPRLLAAFAAMPSGSAAVVCDPDRVDAILQTPGLPPPDTRDARGNLAVLVWKAAAIAP